MRYGRIVQAKFIDRPNRFIAHVEMTNQNPVTKGQNESVGSGAPGVGTTACGQKPKAQVMTVHVKNTGRCRELLLPGATVYLEKSDNPGRRTAYDLVAVQKKERLVNMDSQAPNKVVGEWIAQKEPFGKVLQLRPETVFGSSRFDFYVETEEEKIFIEVKGVTREQENVVCFPDAPSERAIKHVKELTEAKRAGYRAIVLFVVQMEGVRFFTPDRERHEAFGAALCEAASLGVEIFAYECKVEPDSLAISHRIPVSLDGREPESLENLNEKLSRGLLSQIPNPLLKWYDSNRRFLPWREKPAPYRVWVSEIMLQQTRVEAVKPYFERFMDRLPRIEDLAQAEEEELLKLWEGLGYYNRVRNLQKAANIIMDKYRGEMPKDYEDIVALPGIGSYTAGAIASIAFGQAYPAVDGNVLRVLSRVRADERLISDGRVKNLIEQELLEVIPGDRPGDFNQAMMELGACVCLPTGAPKCTECPLSDICEAHYKHREEEFPKKEKKRERTIEEKTILVIRDENKAALHKRPKKGLLAGMYEFPSLEGYHSAEEVVRYLEKKGFKTLRITALREAKHIFTHKEWHMRGYMVRVDELEDSKPVEEAKEWVFVEPADTDENYPIPSAFEAYTECLKMKLGSKSLKKSMS